MRPVQAKVDAASCRVPPTCNAAGCRVYCLAVAAALAILAPGLAAAQDGLLSNMLRVQKDWLWFNVVDGRLSLRMTQLAQFETTSSSGKRRESFSLHHENGQPRLTYQRTTEEELLKVVVAGAGDDLQISRVPQPSPPAPLPKGEGRKGKLLAVEFRQMPGEPVVLKLGTGPTQQVFRAADLWRLLVEHPKECREHLVPLLDALRPGKRLADAVTEVEAKLLEAAGGEAAAQRARLAELVRRLGDESFTRREAADRDLRAAGHAATVYLRHLDPGRLDPEQQFRIRRILEAAAAQTADDSPEQAAASLAGDPLVWLALLSRPEPATRKTAAKQLASLLGGPIGLEPAGDPDSQKDQREQLRRRIEGK